jgi:hypothetical protein
MAGVPGKLQSPYGRQTFPCRTDCIKAVGTPRAGNHAAGEVRDSQTIANPEVLENSIENNSASEHLLSNAGIATAPRNRALTALGQHHRDLRPVA